ncbi:right-handed parallel beta-helix repeat-containing protein [Dactylosporangium sp. CA-092794]|uniref:right-handed parallel beta-helix repeat-containing protein n=1 Tax=Dactylosporangium sp. CA-092794 TaxID=3239929 RepID=UPI003D94C8B6
MAVDRRTALLLGVPAALATLAAPGVASADPPPGTGFVPATDLGIATTNSAATNRASLVAALSNSAVCVVFPPGDYPVDNTNSPSYLVISNFAGELVMLPGARFVFGTNTAKGLIFDGGTGARLYGLTTAFATAPTGRVNAEECVSFLSTTDTYVENAAIDGSAAAGLFFQHCVRPTVVRTRIANTMADGLHFKNCQDPRADQITTTDTGDDGVAFVNYASGPANTGGLATNISVTRSKSRGVSVVGQSGVTVRDARIDTTAGHGLYCAFESSWSTRTPTDVCFERARVVAGGVVVGGAGGSSSGVRVSSAGTVSVAAVTVDAPGQHGVFVSQSTVTLTDVAVSNTPGSGFNLQTSTCTLDRLLADGTNGIGLTATGNARVEYGTITLRNTAKTHATHRALNLDSNTRVFGQRAWITDTQTTATGYVVGAYGTQQGNLGTVVDLVNTPDLLIDNPSGLGYVRV